MGNGSPFCAKWRLERMELCQAMGKRLCWELTGEDQREGKKRGCHGAILHIANFLSLCCNNHLQSTETSNTLPPQEYPAIKLLNSSLTNSRSKCEQVTRQTAHFSRNMTKTYSVGIQNCNQQRSSIPTFGKEKENKQRSTNLKLLALLLVFSTKIYMKPHKVKSQRKNNFTHLQKITTQSNSPPFSTNEADFYSSMFSITDFQVISHLLHKLKMEFHT